MTELEQKQDYFFDLNGYLILDDALSSAQLEWIHDWIDRRQAEKLENGQWVGNVQAHSYTAQDGYNFQNIIEGGNVFEELIDNPAWIHLMRRYITSDFNRLALDETFLNVRGPGQHLEIHSGGQVRAPIMTFRHHNTGDWQVGQINVLMALQDVGPGDGATVVIPGSHKSAVTHPYLAGSESTTYDTNRVNPLEVEGTVEVHLKAGQALMFTDSIMHGGSARVNEGERRILIYRYVPHNIMPRFNYIPSEELLARLTPERRDIVASRPLPRLAPGQVLRGVEDAAFVGG